MRLFVFLMLFFSFSLPALSSQNLWLDVAEDAKLRVIFSNVLQNNGVTMAALEIEMPQTLNTYWRVPGETGIPLMIESSASEGIGEIKIIWPMPRREILYGYVDYIYRGNFILPLEIVINGPSPKLDMQIILGVCSDICVPVKVDISQELTFEKSNDGAANRIEKALANTPVPWQGEQSPIGSIVYHETTGQLWVEVLDRDLDISSLIATIGNEMTVFSVPQKSQIEGVYILDKLGGGKIDDWRGQYVSIIFLSSLVPYEINRLLEFSN